jgi:hypothetical protein
LFDPYASKSANGSRERVKRAMRSQPFALLKKLRVNETDASVFFAVLNHKRAATRRIITYGACKTSRLPYAGFLSR